MGSKSFFLLAFCLVVQSLSHASEEQAQPIPLLNNEQSTDNTENSSHHFDILEYQVAGNHLLPAETIELALEPYLGPERTSQDVDSARQALEKFYHDRGYLTVLVDVPAQKLENGVVHLKVTEAPIGKFRIKGSRYHTLAGIRETVTELAPGRVPDFNQLQAQLKKANISADLVVSPVLRPGRTPGTVEAELQVKDNLPLHGSVELNDRYSQNTSHLRLNSSLRYDNLWQKGHSLGINWITSPENFGQTGVLNLTYVWPLKNSTLAFYTVNTHSDVNAVGDLAVIGEGNISGVRWIKPMYADSHWALSLTLGVDYKNFHDSLVLGSTTERAHVSYLPWLAQWSMTSMEANPTRISLAANFNMRMLNEEDINFANKRFNARANYFTLRAEANTSFALPNNLRLALRGSAQYTNEPLINNEQFAAGGMDSVRGYTEGERLGDQGLNFSIELHSPKFSWDAMNTSNFGSIDSFLFADWAMLNILSPLPTQQNRFNLASTGLGIQLQFPYGLSAMFNVAVPLIKDVNHQRNPRMLFQLGYDF